MIKNIKFLLTAASEILDARNCQNYEELIQGGHKSERITGSCVSYHWDVAYGTAAGRHTGSFTDCVISNSSSVTRQP